MRILLTGASGFVGAHVLRHILATTSHEVVCPVTFRHRGNADRIASSVQGNAEWARRVEVVMHDLTAPASLTTLRKFETCEAVINVASESHVDRSIETPAPFIENNVALMVNVLDIARDIQPRVFVQVSTDEVYGPAPAGHDHVEWETILPSNPYSASKACQEAIAFSYWRTYGVPLVITNTMNIFGEMQHVEKVIPKTIKSLVHHQPMTVHVSADGTPGSRFYLHARNQADALLWIVENIDPVLYGQADRPERFNIVGEREISNIELVERIAELMGVPALMDLVDFHSSRPGHDLRYALDGTKLKEAGWKAPMGLDESLASTVEWTMSHREWLL
jgi:dTDP-glucose 4,6-dehydratase